MPPRRTRDDFDGPALAPHWVSFRRSPTEASSLARRPGWLALAGDESTLDTAYPAFVGRRQQHHHCTVTTCVDPGSAAEAGLAVVMDDTADYEVALVGDRVLARARVGSLSVVLGEAPRPSGPVVLAIRMAPHPHGPDTRRARLSRRGQPTPDAGRTGRALSRHGGHGRVSGPHHRHVRGRRLRVLRLVRVRGRLTCGLAVS